MSEPETVAIVGAGLAGLACAVRLREAGAKPILLECSDDVGGRVRTDVQDGFLLDRGFQVYLSAYPQAGQLLDLEDLNLRSFRPGALVFEVGKFRRLMDVFRCPRHLAGTALQPIGTIKDKLLVGLLRLRARRSSVDAIWSRRDTSTEHYLREFGFSERMIDSFFRLSTVAFSWSENCALRAGCSSTPSKCSPKVRPRFRLAGWERSPARSRKGCPKIRSGSAPV